MTRRLIRGVVALACALALMGTSCSTLLGPEGLVPAGDYRITQSIAASGLAVPVPPGSQPGCGSLVDGRLVIGEDGSVLHTRRIRHVKDGHIIFTEEEFRPKLQRYSDIDRTNLAYRGWSEKIHQQVEPTASNPNFTVLYIDQLFRGNEACPPIRLMLRYTVGGV